GFAGLRPQFDVPVMRSNDSLYGIETQTRPLADFLRRKKRIEDTRPNLFRYSRAAVSNFNNEKVDLAENSNAQLALSIHRVDRVVDQVGPHLIQFAAVGAHAGKIRLVVALDRDALFQAVAEDLQRVLDILLDIDFLQRRLVHVRIALDRRN